MEEFNEKICFSNTFFKAIIPKLFCKGFLYQVVAKKFTLALVFVQNMSGIWKA